LHDRVRLDTWPRFFSTRRSARRTSEKTLL
jgi:hypothetical protein